MKNLFFTLLFSVSAIHAYCQPEDPGYSVISSKLASFYNNSQYDSIWHLFSKEMQNYLPAEKTVTFFSGIKGSYGNIEKKEFDHSQSKIAIYKITFEKSVMAMHMSLDDLKISGLKITQFASASLPELKRNTTRLALPFTGEWTVFWGGDTKELNYHVVSAAQKGAFDMIITNAEGKSYKTDGKKNEDYYAFAQPITAPCDAEVVMAVDGIKDNIPGNLNPIYLTGNSVILKTSNNEYLLFAHFKERSIKVKEGKKIKQGQLLGLCGNTGNSSEPHLHFHMQNVEDMNIATGAKCYFDKIMVNDALQTDYSPVKGDKVKNIN